MQGLNQKTDHEHVYGSEKWRNENVREARSHTGSKADMFVFVLAPWL